MFKNVKILEFGDYIWNHHEKCIEISTNMPGICLDIFFVKFREFCETKRFCMDGETNGCVRAKMEIKRATSMNMEMVT